MWREYWGYLKDYYWFGTAGFFDWLLGALIGMFFGVPGVDLVTVWW